jgi:glycosyltransferase involved in cell wall biosynthesis
MERVGVLYPSSDPISAANWSGTPRGLSEGLRSIGLTVVPIPCILPMWRRASIAVRSRIPMGYMTFHRSAGFVKARSQSIAEAIHKAGRLDGLIAMGTDMYDLEIATRDYRAPLATYDDGNFALFLRYPDSDISRLNLPEAKLRSWTRLQRIACRRASIACVSTELAKRSAIKDFDLPEERVQVVGMGHRPRSKSMIERNFDTPRFLFVGVEWKRKNGDMVLEAFAKVHQRIPQATLSVVGAHPPLNQPGVTGYGFLPRENPEAQKLLDDLFASSTVFVLPSLFDPSPIAYLEAASSGLPVIATTCGGAGELLDDAAISVDPWDCDALVAAMLRLSDKNTARVMGERALIRSNTSSWKDVGKRIVDGLNSAGNC